MFSLKLKFNDKEIESKFAEDYAKKTLFAMRTGLVLCITLSAIFGILDIWIVPETRIIIGFIRFFIIVPVLLIIMALSFTNGFGRYSQLAMSVASAVVGLGIVAMIAVTHKTELGYTYYYSGLIITLIGTYTLMRLRFFTSLIAGLIITIAYQLVAIFTQNLLSDGLPIFINNNFFLVSTSIIGACASYHFEKLFRENYLSSGELLNLSVTDGLTGIINRRGLNEILRKDALVMPRANLPYSVIMFDIDHFKNVNDTFGHQSGDSVLIEVAELANAIIKRPTDALGRYGGEEFMVLCKYTNDTGAVILAEKLRKAFEAHDFKGVGKLTCSFGVSCYDFNFADPMMDQMQLCIKQADNALYSAKESGRNKVVKA